MGMKIGNETIDKRNGQANRNDKGMWSRMAVVPFCFIIIFGLVACGSAGESKNTSSGYFDSANTEMATDAIANDGGYYAEFDGDRSDDMLPTEKAETIEQSESEAWLDERKLIKTVDMEVETKEYDMVMSKLEHQIGSLGGYIERSDAYNGSTYYGRHSERYANMTIRIPKKNLSAFVETVSGICNVVRRSDNVEDVTLSYVDMESRRDSLKIEQERLLVLLEQAGDLNAIITLEERLSEVRYQLESMESRLRSIDNRVDFSTVYLNVAEVKELTPVVEQTALERITEGFRESLEDIAEDAVEFAVWFVINIPYFVVWGIVLTIMGIILHLLGKRSRRLRAEKDKRTSESLAIDESNKEK